VRHRVGVEADPIDAHSLRAIGAALADRPHRVLYPGVGSSTVPLARLGALAGWHHPSPLGLGIHPEHGLWFAYRALVVLAAPDLEPTPPAPGGPPCESCVDQPCLRACPAGAVDPAGFRVRECVEFRVREASPCQDRCLARLACPVGAASRYDPDQLAYHYLQSLATIRRYRRS
jgi:hypothetical protein